MSAHSAFTVIAPVERGRVGALGDLLDQIGDHIDDNPHIRFAELDGLHYASFVIFHQDGPEPFLSFEGNVDGPSEDFLRRMVARSGAGFDAIYAHCVGYPPAGSGDPEAVVHYLTSRDLGADAFYIAWRGRSVAEIVREQELRERLGRFLDEESRSGALDGLSPDVIRERMQELVRSDPLLEWARSAPPRPFLVRRGGLVFGLVVAPPAYALLSAVKAAWRSPSRKTRRRARLALLAIGGLAGTAAWALRSHERTDDRKDAARRPGWETVYAEWSESLANIVQRENVRGQNHLASITQIKQGRFRLLVLTIVLAVINRLAQLVANRGALGGLATIHFARWVITADRRHLVFLSNFDGSWERYLNDFIDLASNGLNAVWSNTENEVGYPSTRWLLTEGASDEQRLKSFARYSQARTRAWYSAYPALSVDNISNNMVIREQLFGPLEDPEAWLRRF